MARQMNGQRGQALILITFAMIGLIAIVGLAVDGSMAFSDRRHAQNAADTAAMAGAMAKINEDPFWGLTARNMAANNGYDGNPATNTVEVFTCDMPDSSCGPQYAGDPDYVQVIIHSRVSTFFAGVIGIGEMNNTVQAVALANSGGDLYGGENIIALKPTCGNPGNITVGGNTSVNLTDSSADDGVGGLYINTASGCGFTCNSAAVGNSTDVNGIIGDITTAGGEIDFGGQCTNVGENSTAGTQWEFPVTLGDVGIDVPPECTSPLGTYKNYNGTYGGADGAYIGDQLTVLTPGLYNDFPPPKLIEEGKLYNKILMLPGVYCVHNVIKLTDQKLWLIGHDVTFFIRSGYDFNINGGTVELDAPDEGDYKGYLFVVEPNYGNPVLSTSSLDCIINGGSDNTFEGAIFAPYCDCKINGTSENNNIDSQVICYTVAITGGGTMNISYDANKNPTVSTEVGLIK
jgi:hypothetical protein